MLPRSTSAGAPGAACNVWRMSAGALWGGFVVSRDYKVCDAGKISLNHGVLIQ